MVKLSSSAAASYVYKRQTLHSVYVNLSGKKEKWEYATGVRLEKMDKALSLQAENQPDKEVINYDYLQLYPSATIQYSLKNKVKIKACHLYISPSPRY